MSTLAHRGTLLTAAAARKLEVAPAVAAGHTRGNVIRLAVAQALAGANSTVVYATGAVVGNMLAPD
jgi:hypothetical protein